jgi:Flp pilus assembly protein TadD
VQNNRCSARGSTIERWFLTLGMVAGLSGLCSCSKTVKLYKGPSRPNEEVAVFILPKNEDVRVHSVDGEEAKPWVKRFELLPGSHGALVSFARAKVTYGYDCMYTQKWYGQDETLAPFEAEAGHTYSVYAEVRRDGREWKRSDRLPDSWFESLPKGAWGEWRPVVYDMDTGQAVSDASALVGVSEAGLSARGCERETTRGFALLQLGEYEQALEAFDRAIEFRPESVQPWLGKGLALRCLERYAESRQAYERALELKPDRAQKAVLYSEMGRVLHSMGEYAEALKWLERALRLDPEEEETWGYKGMTLLELGRAEDALGCFEHVLTNNPQSGRAWYWKGIVLDSLGRHAEASEAYERASRLE